MAATVEIDESNGAGETVTHNVKSTNMGDRDAANLDPVTYPIKPGNRSFIKYLRIHVTAMGGSSKIDNIRVWRAGALGGSARLVTNARSEGYRGALKYAAPVKIEVPDVDQAMPTGAPDTANVGIGGSLTGNLREPGYSDYIGVQMVIGSGDTQGSSSDLRFQWDEVA